MSNVLPHEARRAIWRMYRARFIIAGSLVALAAALLSAAALSPSYIALHIDQGASASHSSRSAADEKDREAVQRAQSLLITLSPLIAASTTPTEAMNLALGLRPRGVVVDHVSYASGNPATIMVVGSAPARGAVNAYRGALDADPHFSNVSVPVGDLAGAAGGRFSMTLSGNF